MKHSRTPHLVILGRPNVGKSTLFNRLLGRKRALVHDEPGVTRDRMEEKAEWYVHGRKHEVLLVDTGGLGGERFAEEIQQQVDIALGEADAVIFLLDGRAGLLPDDEDLARKLQMSGIMNKVPVFAVVNKVDHPVHEDFSIDFYALGVDKVLTVSAEHGRGMDELKVALAEAWGWLGDEVSQDDSEETELSEPAEPSSEIIKIAIVGRPNVGKSTLVNAMLGEDRMITSPIAGTTVDAIDSRITLDGKPFLVIDTAGIRRKSRTEQGIEVLSVVQAKKALERADVAVLLIDGSEGPTDQDMKIASIIEEVGCGVVVCVNKWDCKRGEEGFTKSLAAEIMRKQMPFLHYAPLLFTSAIEKSGFEGLGDLITEILHQRSFKVPTHEFTEWVRKESEIANPANAKFYLCHQTSRHPPTFVCHVNDPEKVHYNLHRHLINALRERWGFMGSPIRLLIKEGKNRKSLPRK